MISLGDAEEGYELRREEASFYVDDAQGDLDLAMRAAIKDLDWERENQAKITQSVEPVEDQNPLKQMYSMFKDVFSY